MGTLGSRVTTFGLADLRGGLSAGFDEGAWITTSYGVGQMLVGVASPYLGAMFGVRRVLLLGILLFFVDQPARAAVAEPQRVPGDAVSRRRRLRHVHSAHHQLHRPQPAGAARRLRHRPLCDEFRTVAERRGIARGLVFGPLVLALDRLAILRDAAADVRLRLVRHTARADEHGAAAQPRLARARVCRDRVRAALCGARPGQPAGLEQQRPGQRTAAVRRAHDARVRGARADHATAVPQPPAAGARGTCRYLLLLLAGFRFIILSTAYIIPTYLQTVQNYRELQVGAVLLWIALPQFAHRLSAGCACCGGSMGAGCWPSARR